MAHLPTIDPPESRADRETIRLALGEENFEARRVWTPMHLHPVFARSACFGGEVGAAPNLPSGSELTTAYLEQVVEIVRRVRDGHAR